MEVDAGLSNFAKAFLQLGIVGIFGPKVGIGCNHTIERHDFTRSDFVHHLKPHTNILWLAFLDGAITKLGVVGGRDFLNIEQDALVADDIVGHIMHIVNSHIVTNVARGNATVGNAHRHTKVVVLQHLAADATDAYLTEEMVVMHHVGVELVRHPNVFPIRSGVAVFHQTFNFIGMQTSPTTSRLFHLLVAVVIFVMPVQVLLINEVLVNPVIIYDCYFIHLFFVSIYLVFN